MCNVPIKVSAHTSLHSSKGVIRSRDVEGISEDEMLENLSSQGVSAVKRIHIRRNNELVPTNNFILTFCKPLLPDSIKAGYLKIPFIPNPLRCFKCHRYGHVKNACGKVTCARCGQVDHESKTCHNAISCVIARATAFPVARRLVETCQALWLGNPMLQQSRSHWQYRMGSRPKGHAPTLYSDQKLDYGCIMYGSARVSYLQMLDPKHNQGLRLCLGAFRTSPVEGLYVDAHEPTLGARRGKLSLQYATKIKSLPNHPAHNAVFDNTYMKLFDARPSAIRTFGLRIKQLLTASNIDFSYILKTASHFILPPWCIKPPKIVLDLVHLEM